MRQLKGQKNVRWFFKPFIAILPHLIPKQSLTLDEVGQAMIHTITRGYHKVVLEIGDIRELAGKGGCKLSIGYWLPVAR